MRETSLPKYLRVLTTVALTIFSTTAARAADRPTYLEAPESPRLLAPKPLINHDGSVTLTPLQREALEGYLKDWARYPMRCQIRLDGAWSVAQTQCRNQLAVARSEERATVLGETLAGVSGLEWWHLALIGGGAALLCVGGGVAIGVAIR